MISSFLVVASAAVIFALGAAHLALTFYGPKLLPRDPSVLAKLRTVSPNITSQTTMWKAWIGFNASHSLGALLFGATYAYLALTHARFLFESTFLGLVGLLLLLSYATLGWFYWFSTPFRGIVLALLLYVGGYGVALAQSDAPRVDGVLTQRGQQALTSDAVLRRLKRGNERFLSGQVTERDHSAQVRAAAGGQFPKAMVLSCIDSRIPVEDVFDQGIGDVFVARVAGNFENTDILGSMEYATKVSGAKLVVVLGHEDCGAIKAAIDGVTLGNITAMLENIRPAVDALASYPGDRTSKNPEFVHLVAKKNVELTMERVRERSPILKELERNGQVEIVGALYEMKTGAIDFID